MTVDVVMTPVVMTAVVVRRSCCWCVVCLWGRGSLAPTTSRQSGHDRAMRTTVPYLQAIRTRICDVTSSCVQPAVCVPSARPDSPLAARSSCGAVQWTSFILCGVRVCDTPRARRTSVVLFVRGGACGLNYAANQLEAARFTLCDVTATRQATVVATACWLTGVWWLSVKREEREGLL